MAGEAAALTVPRERVRAGAALAFAVEYAATLHRSGRSVRSDGWFAARPREPSGRRGGRRDGRVRGPPRPPTSAGCATWAICSPRRPSPPTSTADLVARTLRIVESLSWRQLALLAGVGRRDRVPLPMAPLEDDPRAWTAWGAREDVADLRRAGLLDPPALNSRPGAVLPRLRMADLRLTRRGVLVHRLLVLDLLHDDAVTAALADLGLPRS